MVYCEHVMEFENFISFHIAVSVANKKVCLELFNKLSSQFAHL